MRENFENEEMKEKERISNESPAIEKSSSQPTVGKTYESSEENGFAPLTEKGTAQESSDNVIEEVSDGTDTPQEKPKKKRKMKKPILIALLSGAAVMLVGIIIALILFMPIFFGNHFDNTFGELLFDDEVILEVIEELYDDGYLERMDLNIDGGITFDADGIKINTEAYGIGSEEKKRETCTVALKTKNGYVECELYIDADRVSLGGIYGAGTYVSFPRKNFEEELSKSVFHPKSGSKYALDQESYDMLKSMMKEPVDTEIYYDFIDELLSEWEDIVEIESEISFADHGFKLEREVTYKASYADICDMIDVAFTLIDGNDEIKSLLFDGSFDMSMANQYKQAFYGLSFELYCKVRGSELAEVKLSTWVWDSFTSSYRLVPITDNDRTIGAVLYADGPSQVYSKKYEYSVYDEGEKTYYSLTSEQRNEKKSILEAEYAKDGKYEIVLYSDGEELLLASGVLLLDEDECSIRFTVEECLYMGRDILTLELEINKDENARNKCIIPESTDILSATEEEIDALVSGADSSEIARIIYNVTGKVTPELNLYPPKTIDEEIRNAVYSFSEYKSKYGGNNNARYYSKTFDTYILMNWEGGYVTYECKSTITATEKNRYYALQEKQGFVLHAFERYNSTPASCLEPEYNKYRCKICGVTTESYYGEKLGHSINKVVEEDFLHDDGHTYKITLSYCQRCEKPDFVAIGDHIMIDFAQNSRGELTRCVGTEFFAVPDIVYEYCSNFEIKLGAEGNYTSIRIPYGVEELGDYSLSKANNAQVLIIPRTVKIIRSNAFSGQLSLSVIFFEGTEEEWETISLNDYRTEWADVEVIFRPEGVSSEDLLEWCIFDVPEKIARRRILTSDMNAITELASINSAIEIIYSDKVTGRILISEDRRILVSVTSERVATTDIKVYDTETGELMYSVSLDESIDHLYLGDKYMVMYGITSTTIHALNIKSGELKESVMNAYADAIYNLFAEGDLIFFQHLSRTSCILDCFSIAEQKYVMQLADSLGTLCVYNKGAKKAAFISASRLDSCVIHIFSTETLEIVKSIYRVSITREALSNYKYGSFVDNNGTVYDVDGNVIDKTIEKVQIDVKEHRHSVIIDNDLVTVFMSVKPGLSEAFLVIVRHSDGKRIEIPYYADRGYMTENGNIILYTEGGFGVISINIDEL